MRSTMAPGTDAWAASLRYLMGAVLASGGALLATFGHMQKTIVAKNEKPSKELKASKEKKKPRMSMMESAKFLMSSPYIRDLALLVISYGMCINIVEVSWKAKLKVRDKPDRPTVTSAHFRISFSPPPPPPKCTGSVSVSEWIFCFHGNLQFNNWIGYIANDASRTLDLCKIWMGICCTGDTFCEYTYAPKMIYFWNGRHHRWLKPLIIVVL